MGYRNLWRHNAPYATLFSFVCCYPDGGNANDALRHARRISSARQCDTISHLKTSVEKRQQVASGARVRLVYVALTTCIKGLLPDSFSNRCHRIKYDENVLTLSVSRVIMVRQAPKNQIEGLFMVYEQRLIQRSIQIFKRRVNARSPFYAIIAVVLTR